MDYKSVDKAHRWHRSDEFLETWSKMVAGAKRNLEGIKNTNEAYLKRLQSLAPNTAWAAFERGDGPKAEGDGVDLVLEEGWDDLTPMRQLQFTRVNMVQEKCYQQELKLFIYIHNGDLHNCIKSFEKLKEVSCDFLEEIEERVQRGLSKEGLYLKVCKRWKEQVGDLSTFFKKRMECYKWGCGCCVNSVV